jgi:Ni/Co efflux regulator RcnB
MRKTVLTILAASLIVGSTLQLAGAAERHTHQSDRAQAPASQQLRDANDSLASPSAEQQNWSDYSEGHVISAPAGR